MVVTMVVTNDHELDHGGHHGGHHGGQMVVRWAAQNRAERCRGEGARPHRCLSRESPLRRQPHLSPCAARSSASCAAARTPSQQYQSNRVQMGVQMGQWLWRAHLATAQAARRIPAHPQWRIPAHPQRELEDPARKGGRSGVAVSLRRGLRRSKNQRIAAQKQRDAHSALKR